MRMIPYRWILAMCLMLLGVTLFVTPALTQTCPHDGDVNQDGRYTPADALLAFKHFLQLLPLDTCQQARADVDANGSITPADALCVFRAALGQPSCLPTTSDFILNTSRLDHARYRLR